MASPCVCNSLISLKINRSQLITRPLINQRSGLALKCMNGELYGHRVLVAGARLSTRRSFTRESGTLVTKRNGRSHTYRKSFEVNASWFAGPQIASSVFTLGTAAVLPFYTLMVLAPNAELRIRCRNLMNYAVLSTNLIKKFIILTSKTKKLMQSTIPYVMLGLLYTYLLCLSWTPDTLRLMFSSKYWLPELSAIAKMFSNEITLASAWIHLLAVDLFAARQVYHDGLVNKIETRHSVSLCLLFCPIGIVTHAITRSLTKNDRPLH